MATYTYYAAVLRSIDEKVNAMIYRGLRSVGSDTCANKLLAMVMKVGEFNLACMEILATANHGAFRISVPARVTNAIEKDRRSSFPVTT